MRNRREKALMGKIALIAGFIAAIAGAPLGMSSPAHATTYTGGLGTQSDPDWSVTVGPGISLVESILYTGSTTPAGPANQGYTTGSGHLLDWIQNTAGFSGAGLVTNGQVTGMSFTVTDADLFGVHFGCGNSGPCELVWLFSGDTTFTVNSLHGFSNISAFNDPTATPLPGALPLFAGGLGMVGFLARRRKRAAALVSA
jgi:hypothetical protein